MKTEQEKAKTELEDEKRRHEQDRTLLKKEYDKLKKESGHETARLQKQIEKLTEKRKEIANETKKSVIEKLRKGKELYAAAARNEQIKACGREEQELLRYFYCNVVDRSFEAKILEKYDRLTPYNWAVLTLKAMGKTKKEAAHILDVDYGALRTMLHSIVEKKARNDNEAV